jgi:hypothetical protein
VKGRVGRLLIAAPLLSLVVVACAGTDADGPDSGVEASSGQGRAGLPQTAIRRSDPVPAPAQLVGLDADQVEDLLGPADFTRSDGPAEIRQYRDAACVLDLFLYADAASGRYRVAHVAARDLVSGGTAEQGCAASLLRARHLRTISEHRDQPALPYRVPGEGLMSSVFMS